MSALFEILRMNALFEILRKLPWPVWLVAFIFLLRKIKVRRPRRDAEFQEEETPSDEWEEFPQEEALADERAPETLSDKLGTETLSDERGRETLSPEEEKGRRGEDLIAEILQESVTGEYELLRNVYVPNGDKTAEIDLVMVHERGIFVFESKNYAGMIFGSKDGLNWIQRFPNGERHSFYNPVRQNENHIKALSRYLGIPRLYFCSYIVFSGRCQLKNVPESNYGVVITRTSELQAELGRILKFPSRFHGKRFEDITERLLPLTNGEKEVKAKHIQDIRDAQHSTICPFCGAELAVRHGKYGDFWGCSSYPNCKFKRKIEG